MKLYVNGDSHTAGAEAVNPHAFAEDESRYFYLGRAPHPENAAVAWPAVLAHTIKATLHNDSESASSNQRILRTTRQWVAGNQTWLPETVIIIQWSTWEREEWIIEGRSYQVNGSGIDAVPKSHQQHYRQWVADLDWRRAEVSCHKEIWCLHKELEAQHVRHVFFNGNLHFGRIPVSAQLDWGDSYIAPYRQDLTYDSWLKNNGHHTVTPDSWHFGREAHAAWAGFMLQYGISHKLWR